MLTLRFYPALGGVERTSWETARGLARKGHSVTAFTSNINTVNPRSFFNEKCVEIEHVRICRFKNIVPYFLDQDGEYGFIMPGQILSMASSIRNFDVVHSHGYGFFSSYSVLPFVRGKKFRWIVTAHTSPDSQLPRWLYDYTIGRLVLRYADAVICQTELEREFLKRLGKDERDLPIIPNGVHYPIPHDAQPSESVKAVIEKGRYGLFVGRIAPNKGLDLLLKAAANALKEERDLYFVIAGPDGGFRQRIEQLIAELGLQQKVFLTGPVTDNDLHWLYSNALFFASPSLYGEAQNISAAQAVKYGKPVIVSNTGGMGDFYKNIEGAVIVEKGNLDELKRAIDFVVKNAERIQVCEKKKVIYSWQEVVDMTERVYRGEPLQSS